MLISGVFILLSACTPQQKFDEASERSRIMALHNLQRTYHFEKMTEEFVTLFSENHISVNRGAISRPSGAENRERFNRYFESVEFEKWDDIDPPVIRFSDDGSMAYTIVHKEVVVNYRNEDNEKVRESTGFSWVAIYKKYAGEWKIDCVASTNKPGISTITNQHGLYQIIFDRQQEYIYQPIKNIS